MTTETTPHEAGPAVPCCGTHVPDESAEVRQEAARLATAFKALSDETRLRIFRRLAASETPLCECEIVPAFGLSQSTISYHLKVLREAGLVEVERRGVWGYYRARPRALIGLVAELAAMA